jgi:hypothetical protein
VEFLEELRVPAELSKCFLTEWGNVGLPLEPGFYLMVAGGEAYLTTYFENTLLSM